MNKSDRIGWKTVQDYQPWNLKTKENTKSILWKLWVSIIIENMLYSAFKKTSLIENVLRQPTNLKRAFINVMRIFCMYEW